MITSTSNQQMKNIMQLHKKSKTRWEQRVFVAEGPKMCLEAPKKWIERMYVSESYGNEPKHQEQLAGYDYEVVSDSVLKAVSDTMTPQGILCLIRMPEYTMEDLLGRKKQAENKEILCPRRHPHLLLLEGIQDPGNLGTMLRTGEGAGITGIIMDKETVDVFNSKTVRSTMGSIYRVPFLVVPRLEEAIVEVKKAGVYLCAAHLKGAMSYDEPNYQKPCGFLIGNEGNGLREETARLADTYIRIPMEGKVESLNAAIAATLLMYEANRQRR